MGCHFLLQGIFPTQESNCVSSISCVGRQILYQLHHLKSPLDGAAAAKLLQSCLILCDPIDGSPPGSAVPGILQAKILEWVAIAFSIGGAI